MCWLRVVEQKLVPLTSLLLNRHELSGPLDALSTLQKNLTMLATGGKLLKMRTSPSSWADGGLGEDSEGAGSFCKVRQNTQRRVLAFSSNHCDGAEHSHHELVRQSEPPQHRMQACENSAMIGSGICLRLCSFWLVSEVLQQGFVVWVRCNCCGPATGFRDAVNWLVI